MKQGVALLALSLLVASLFGGCAHKGPAIDSICNFWKRETENKTDIFVDMNRYANNEKDKPGELLRGYRGYNDSEKRNYEDGKNVWARYKQSERELIPNASPKGF